MRAIMAPTRRSFLATVANPDSRHDYLVELKTPLDTALLEPASDKAVITIRYVPDRLVLLTDSLGGYLRALQPVLPEALALTLLEDLSDVLVPRWLRLDLRLVGPRHRVVVEDRQPSWDNPALLGQMSGV